MASTGNRTVALTFDDGPSGYTLTALRRLLPWIASHFQLIALPT